MSNLKQKLTEGGVTAVIVIIILAVCYGFSWIVTCGIIKLTEFELVMRRKKTESI